MTNHSFPECLLHSYFCFRFRLNLQWDLATLSQSKDVLIALGMLEEQRRLDGNKSPLGHSTVFGLFLHARDSMSMALGLMIDDDIGCGKGF